MPRQYRLVILGCLIYFAAVLFVKAQSEVSEPDFEHEYYVDVEWNNSVPVRIYVGSNSSVYIYDENLERMGQITAENFAYINGLSLSPNANVLAISIDDVANDRVIIWDLLQEQQIAEFYLGATGGRLSWNPSGQRLATTPEDSIRIYDVGTQQVVQEIFPVNPKTPIFELEYSSVNDNIAILNEFGQLQVWDVVSGQLLLDLQNTLYWGFAWSPDGTTIATQNTATANLEFWNVQTASLVNTIPTSTELEHPLWGESGNFATYRRRNDITVWNLDTKNAVETIEVNGFIQYIEWLPDGEQILSSLSQPDIQSAIQITPVISEFCDTIVASASTTTLITAIGDANTLGTPQTLCLEGTYTLTGYDNNPSDGANGLPVIEGNITLYALGTNGATITRASGTPSFRIAKVDTEGELVLQNITISNGSPGGSHKGGAIRNLGTLELINATVTGNTSVNDGGAIFSNNNSILIISDSTFSNNTAYSGGAVYSNTGSSTTITNSNFVNNVANLSNGLGGGFYMNGASLNITDSTFTTNQAKNGGGIFMTVGGSSPAQLDGVSITSNSATNHGGGVYVNSGSVVMDGVTIANNSAASMGGGVRVVAAGTLSINDSVVQNNNGGTNSGGGIASAGTLTVTNTQFIGNYGTGTSFDGGGIHNSGTFTVTNSTIENNQAVDSGGGVYTSTATNNSLQYNCIVGNTAPNTSAVYSAVSTLNAQYNWWGNSSGPTSGQVNSNRVDTSNYNTVSCANALAGGGSGLAAFQSSTPTITTVSAPYENAMEDAVGWQTIGAWSQEALVGHVNGAWVADASIRDRVSSLEMNVAVNLGNNPNPRVRYWQRGTLASSDSMVLEILPQGATTWVMLDQQSGFTSSWTQREIDLSAYRGQTVRLRWTLTTVGEVSPGQSSVDYAIDDLAITSRR